MHVHGKEIRTTAEHPFYVWGKGWTAAKDLLPGDRLRGHDGRMMAVQEAYATGVEEAVYNCAVEDYHTYFVGGEDWGFNVWAHNTYKTPNSTTEWSVEGAAARASHGKWGTFHQSPVDGTYLISAFRLVISPPKNSWQTGAAGKKGACYREWMAPSPCLNCIRLERQVAELQRQVAEFALRWSS